jgi:hypothetical protein
MTQQFMDGTDVRAPLQEVCRNLLHLKVHILHPQAHGHQDSQPAAIEQLDDEFSSIKIRPFGMDRVVVKPQDVADLME